MFGQDESGSLTNYDLTTLKVGLQTHRQVLRQPSALERLNADKSVGRYETVQSHKSDFQHFRGDASGTVNLTGNTAERREAGGNSDAKSVRLRQLWPAIDAVLTSEGTRTTHTPQGCCASS